MATGTEAPAVLGLPGDGPPRLPSFVIWSMVVLAVLPFLLGQFGVDLGSDSHPFPFARLADGLDRDSIEENPALEAELDATYLEPMFHRLAGDFSHTLLEWTAFCLALFTALLAFAHYRVAASRTVAIIAMALFFAGVMDAFHTLAADRLIEAVSQQRDLIPFTWAICRLFNAMIPVVGIALYYALHKRGNWGSAGNLAAVGCLFLLLAYAIIHLCATRQQLPQTTFPDSLISRPWDVAPLCIYVISGLLIFPRFYRSDPSIFSHALLVSVIPNVATQLYMAVGSEALFDHNFNAAHFLKIFAYFIPCLGLIMDYVHKERALQANVSELAESHRELTTAKSAANARERELQGVLNAVLVAVVTIDVRGVVQSFNPAAETLFGYRAREMLGENVSRLMPEPHRGRHDGYLERYLRTGESAVLGRGGRHLNGQRRDGSLVPVELWINEIQIGGRSLFIGCLLDLTERRKGEQALREKSRAVEQRAHNENVLRRILQRFGAGYELSPILADILKILAVEHVFPVSAIYMLDEWKGELELRAAHALAHTDERIALGVGLVGQAGQSQQPLYLTGGEQQPLVVWAGPLGLSPTDVAALPIVRRERLLGVLLVASTSPLNDDARTFLESLRVQLAAALTAQEQYRSLKSLSEQLRQQGEEIRLANVELRRASRLKSEFLANMSHELRTPLNAIIGFSEVLRDGIAGELEAEQRDYLSEIAQSGNHLLSLINDILDLSKIEAGKMTLQARVLDAGELLAGCLNIVREPALKTGVELALELADSGLRDVWIDERKLKQIVYNLLANAVKFTPKGGKVRMQARRIAAAQGKPALLEVVVSDTGIGIPREYQSRLFQPFEQLDGSLTRQFGGTGLGLHLVKRLLDFLGGSVEVLSEAGEGSRFTVRIPCVKPAAAIPSVQTQRAEPEPAPEICEFAGTPQPEKDIVILAVGSRDDSAQRLAAELALQGYMQVRIVQHIEELCLPSGGVPDLLLAVIAPGESGAILLRLAAHSLLRNVPLVLVVSRKGIDESVVLSADAVLQKPVQHQQLLTTIRKLTGTNDTAQILIVDDDPRAVRVLASFFHHTSFQLECAYGGREALEFVARHAPDLILLDLMMPEVSGFEVLRRLKGSASTATIPVVIVTAKTLSDDERSDLETQACAIAQKAGLQQQRLLRLVRSLLREA